MAQVATVVDCVNALTVAVSSVTGLNNKVVFAYNENDFQDKVKSLGNLPGAAIVYEGMRSMPEEGRSAKVGVSAEIVLSIILITPGEAIYRNDQTKINALAYLDSIRGILMATRSPTGHFWHFLVEAPAEVSKGMVFWVSRWSTPIQLPPKLP